MHQPRRRSGRPDRFQCACSRGIWQRRRCKIRHAAKHAVPKAQRARMHILFAIAAFCSAFCEPRVQWLLQLLSVTRPVRPTMRGPNNRHTRKSNERRWAMSTSSVQTAQILQFPVGGRKAFSQPSRRPLRLTIWKSRLPRSPLATRGTMPKRSRTPSATAIADAAVKRLPRISKTTRAEAQNDRPSSLLGRRGRNEPVRTARPSRTSPCCARAPSPLRRRGRAAARWFRVPQAAAARCRRHRTPRG